MKSQRISLSIPSLGTENTRADVGNANEHTEANKEKINA